MLSEEASAVKDLREKMKGANTINQLEVQVYCHTACKIYDKEESLSILKNFVYMYACNLDVRNIEILYSIAQTQSVIDKDYTIHDFVISSCYERGDIVTALRWVLLANHDKEDALQLSIGASLCNFKKFPNLELVYTDLLDTLREEYLSLEIGSSSYVVREAVVWLLSETLNFKEMIKIIENESSPSALYCRLWLEHKVECANTKIESISTIEKHAINYWHKLADFCKSDQDVIQNIGRLYYPMTWYLTNYSDEDRNFFEKMILQLLYSNYHITRIKEMMNAPLEIYCEDNFTMYMKQDKFNRIFTPIKGTNMAYWQLSCADHMNDDYEGSVFFDYLKECGVSLFDQNIKSFGLLDSDERSSVFLASISNTLNDEYMYELYSYNNGKKGFCVEFDITSFDDLIEDSLYNDEYNWICPLYRMEYANNIDEIIAPNVKEEIKRLGKELNLISLFASDYRVEHEETILKFSRMIYRMLEEIIYLFKKKSGPDNTAKDEAGIPIIRNWVREREMRIMKCVRGASHNIIESEKCDSKNRHYLNYYTNKRMIVKNIYGGSTEEELNKVQKHIQELQSDL